jgi:hypothetical protein
MTSVQTKTLSPSKLEGEKKENKLIYEYGPRGHPFVRLHPVNTPICLVLFFFLGLFCIL